jgi:hypothetical protein
MRTRFAFLLPVLALSLCAGGVISQGLAQSAGAVAPPANAAPAPQITEEQQGKIRDSVKNAKVDHVAKLAIPLSVGAEVPRNLHFYPFPKEVTEIAPEYGSYFYVVAAEKIVVIDPLSYRIVAIFPA